MSGLPAINSWQTFSILWLLTLMLVRCHSNNQKGKSDMNAVSRMPMELVMNAIVMSAVLLPVMAGMPGGNSGASAIAYGLHSFSGALATNGVRFPVTRTEADAYKLSNPAWKAETLRYLADGIHRAHATTTGTTNVDLDRYDAIGAAVITSNTAIGQGKVQFSVNVPLRDIQTIRIVQPKRSRNLTIELITHSGTQSIHVWRKITSSRTNDTFTAATDRISFVAPESVSGARVLAELLADIIRDAGGSPVISSE